MLSAVKFSSALFVVYGVIGLIVGVAYWLLIGHVSWTFFLPLLFVTAIFLAVGVKLFQLRYWAMIAGRLLALWLVVSYLALAAVGRFAAGHPLLTLGRVAQLVTASAIAITIFLPVVSKTIKRPQGSMTE